MRTTVTLDDDLFHEIRERAHRKGTPFKRELNEALRAGLAVEAPKTRYETEPAAMGSLPGVNLDKALDLVGRLDDAQQLKRLRGG